MCVCVCVCLAKRGKEKCENMQNKNINQKVQISLLQILLIWITDFYGNSLIVDLKTFEIIQYSILQISNPYILIKWYFLQLMSVILIHFISTKSIMNKWNKWWKDRAIIIFFWIFTSVSSIILFITIFTSWRAFPSIFPKKWKKLRWPNPPTLLSFPLSSSMYDIRP